MKLDVRVRPITPKENLVGFAAVTINDCFVVEGLKAVSYTHLAANIGQIPNLEKLMATIRSREISACLVLQAQSQLKALYKDNMDTIIGNCDSSLFLGGKEETTLKSWSTLLGKETIDMYNTSVTKGTQESHGQNFQKLGKDLMLSLIHI